MKVILVHNNYGVFSGEERIVQIQSNLLKENGHTVIPFYKNSSSISNNSLAKVGAFFSGIWSISSQREFETVLQKEKPDVVHVHNLYPLISPSILHVCGKKSVPVVMTVHNYRLICPNGLFMTKGRVCERCSGGREYWCMLRNCENHLLKSLGYALRNVVARVGESYKRNISKYLVLTEFQKRKLIDNGFVESRIEVIGSISVEHQNNSQINGNYVGFVGRVSPEKGVDLLVEAARRCPDIEFKAAGDYSDRAELVDNAPVNFTFLGQLSTERIRHFLAKSRFIVMSSICYEGFPSVVSEAMMASRAVIASGHGGIPEVIDDRKSGLLFAPGDVDDMVKKIRFLWERENLCKTMGENGFTKASRLYNSRRYYEKLIDTYEHITD